MDDNKISASDLMGYSDEAFDDFLQGYGGASTDCETTAVRTVRDPQNLDSRLTRRLLSRDRPRKVICGGITLVMPRTAHGDDLEEASAGLSIVDEAFDIVPRQLQRTPRDVKSEEKYHDKLVEHNVPLWEDWDVVESMYACPTEDLRSWDDLYERHEIKEAVRQSYRRQWARWCEFLVYQADMREVYRGNMAKYAQKFPLSWAQTRLDAKVKLDEDPKQQDMATTWIEYLAFELGTDRCVAWENHCKAWCDQARQAVLDSDILEPGEADTDESLELHYQQLKLDVRQAEEAFNRAVPWAPVPGRKRGEDAYEAMLAGLEELCDLRNVLAVYRRVVHIHGKAMRLESRQSWLIDWIHEQYRLMTQAPSNEKDAAGAGEEKDAGGASSSIALDTRQAGKKRSRDSEDSSGDERYTKRQWEKGPDLEGQFMKMHLDA